MIFGLGHINLGKKGYRVPSKGTIQVTLFNPLGTVVKMFVVMYDLSDMPANSQTFLRQRTLYMPSEGVNEGDMQKWLRYLVHLRYLLKYLSTYLIIKRSRALERFLVLHFIISGFSN